MQLFELQRDRDTSGVSGTGVVAQGVIFDDGITVLHWLGKWNSTSLYPNIDMLKEIHGHHNDTRIVLVRVIRTEDADYYP